MLQVQCHFLKQARRRGPVTLWYHIDESRANNTRGTGSEPRPSWVTCHGRRTDQIQGQRDAFRFPGFERGPERERRSVAGLYLSGVHTTTSRESQAQHKLCRQLLSFKHQLPLSVPLLSLRLHVHSKSRDHVNFATHLATHGSLTLSSFSY